MDGDMDRCSSSQARPRPKTAPLLAHRVETGAHGPRLILTSPNAAAASCAIIVPLHMNQGPNSITKDEYTKTS